MATQWIGAVSIVLCLAVSVEGSGADTKSLVPATGELEQDFGIHLSTRGDLLIVGAKHAAHVYRRSDRAWVPEAALVVHDEDFGHRYIATDGETVMVANPSANQNRGVMYVYRNSNGEWIEEAQLSPPDDAPVTYLGMNAVGSCGCYASLVREVYPTGGQSVVYVFCKEQNAWTVSARLTTADVEPIVSLAPSDDGFVIGLYGESDRPGSLPHRFVEYVRSNGDWIANRSPVPEGLMGRPMEPEIDSDGGATILSGWRTPNSPVVVVFRRRANEWVQEASLVGDLPDAAVFGFALAISNDTALVSSPTVAMYVFRNIPERGWQRAAKVDATKIARFERGRFAVTGNVILIGMPTDGGGRGSVLSVDATRFHAENARLWGMLSTGEPVGTMSRERIQEELRRVADQRREAQGAGNHPAESRLSRDAEVLAARLEQLTD